jgi:hypothetical protein
VASSFAGSSDVFVGTVLSVRNEGEMLIKGRIRVERSWKGTAAGHVVTVYTNINGASCGVDLPVDREVLLFANRISGGRWKGHLAAGLCDGSASYPTVVSALSDSLGAPVTVRTVVGWWPWK